MLEFFKKLFRSLFGSKEEPGIEETPTPVSPPTPEEESAPIIEPKIEEKPVVEPEPEVEEDPVVEADPVAESEPKAEPVNTTSSTSSTRSAEPTHTSEANIEVSVPGDTVQVDIQRFSEGAHDTLGKLYINGKFSCYTLEHSGSGNAEVYLPAGEYELILRTSGGKHTTYMYRFKNTHKGILAIKDQPDFAHIHIGNQDPDGTGSIVVGSEAKNQDQADSKREVWYSQQVYKKIYPALADAIAAGKKVILKIS